MPQKTDKALYLSEYFIISVDSAYFQHPIRQIKHRILISKMEREEFSDEEEHQKLLPIFKMLPANDILPPTYAADGQIKVILSHCPNPFSVSTPKYEFCPDDTLGYYYQRLFHRIVYNSINNVKHDLHLHHSTRYLAGLFFPQIIPQSLTQVHFSKPLNINFNGLGSSRNLLYAFEPKDKEIHLILHNDTNSRGSTQWFYFQVEFIVAGTYSFRIVNMTKKKSLYQQGMGVLYHSSKLNKWSRLNNPLYSSGLKREENSQEYFTLQFQYKGFEEQKVRFAYGYPYSLQQHQQYWCSIQKSLSKRNKQRISVRKVRIGESKTGLPIECFVVKQHEKLHPLESTKSIVVLARQHSGETQGSFLIEGMMDYLLSSNLMLDVRKKFLIHFIPVVNPEGIAHGNYRTNIRGYDINRSWRNPKLEKTPESYYIKVYLKKIHQESPIALILDLHGHSKSFNSFFYGNPKNMQSYTTKENPKFLPYFLSTKIKEISYSQCCFGVTQGKSDTARVVLGEIFPKALVYTIQNSFFGSRTKEKVFQYTPFILRKLGKQILNGIFQFYEKAGKNISYKTQLEKEIFSFQTAHLIQNNRSGVSDSSASQNSLAKIDESGMKSPQKKVIRVHSLKRMLIQPKQDYRKRKFTHLEKSLQMRKTTTTANSSPLKSLITEAMINLLKSPKSKIKSPLLSVNVIKPSIRKLPSAKKTQRKYSKNYLHNGVSFVKEKQYVREEIRRMKAEQTHTQQSEIEQKALSSRRF